ncbi:MAG: thiamine pyrophosphate-dependent enzyme, partial [Candidatus Bathyarchaeota archaeon]|nr:thiamine pyrophosphate-dependent enzyme [Candidatus Bathyarchaeota archaeon]
RQRGNGKLVAVFFGDGAVDEGAFWESLNVACLMKLPIILVCEDNGLAVHTPTSKRRGYTSISGVVAKFNCNVLEDNTTDVEAIYRLTQKAIDLIKTTGMPCFMHLRYYRYLEHVGTNEDFDAGYRSRQEFEEWYKKDPVVLQRQKIVSDCDGSEEAVIKIERTIDSQIERSIRLAKEAPFAECSELYRGVFA